MADDEFDAFDNIELDEELLRALQDTEDRYTLSSASQVPLAAPPKLPQASLTGKYTPQLPRPRTKRWPGLPLRVVQEDTYGNNSGNLPEIVLNSDGSYAMHSISSTSVAQHQQLRQTPAKPPTASTFARLPLHVSNGVPPPHRTTSPPNTLALKGGSEAQSTLVSQQNLREVPTSVNAPNNRRFPSTAVSLSVNARTRTAQVKAQVPSVTTPEPSLSRPSSQIFANFSRPKVSVPSQAPHSVSHIIHETPVTRISSRSGVPASIPADIEVLRKQLLELQKAKDAAQNALEEARQAQYIRDGEIATLRRTMEKQAVSHTESLGKLRDEKAMAENRRTEIEAEMRAEMDRLKTKFQFKQQELETARLRFALGGGPPSTLQRTRYTASQLTQPTPGPSRLQNHHNGNMNIPLTDASPSRRRIAAPLSARSPQAISGKIEPIAFPGFHDSFAPRRPGASKVNASVSPRTSPRKGKGKGKAIEKTNKDISRAPQSPVSLSQRQGHSPGPTREMDGNAFDELAIETHQIQDGDVTSNPLDDVLPLDEGRDLRDRWRINWIEELYRTIFTHCAPPIGKETPQLTMQLLLSTSIPSPLQDTSGDINGAGHSYGQYHRACGNLLNLFGHTSGLNLKTTAPSAGDLAEDSAYQALVKVVGESLLQVANILHIHKLDAPLYGLLDLIKSLVLLFPFFRSFFLVTTSQPGSSTLTTLLCNYMRSFHPSSDLLASPTRHRTKSIEVSLADAIGSIALDIMEALTWSIPDIQVHLLETISADSSMFVNLLSPSQPPWLIQRAVYLLLSLSLRPQLLPSFIGSNSSPNLVVLPYVEHMLSYLATPYPGTPFSEARHLSRSIVGFFANLCTLHDKTSIILETYSDLVPSLVLCLTDAADRFWEEDEDFTNGPTEDHDALIKVLVPTLCLIHHLFYGMEVNSQPSLSADLPHILQQAAGLPAYNGLDHTFIVTMTRLGYADVPEWLGAERVMLVDDVAEVAREMLELFVGGPEADLIVSAYVPDDEDKVDPGEETQEGEPSNDAETMDTDD